MASKSRDAATIKEMAKNRYDRAYADYQEANKRCVEQMKQLDKLKYEIWESFEPFLNVFEKIKNRPELIGQVKDEKIKITEVELDELKLQNSKFKDVVASGMGVATGAVAGTVSATAVLSGIGFSAFTVMGLGEAVVTTASFASVNMALYGAGAVFWPAAAIAAAATAVGAIFSHVHGAQKMVEAHEVERQVDMAYAEFKIACDYLSKLEKTAVSICKTMKEIFVYYKEQLLQLDAVVIRNENYEKFSEEEKYLLEAVTILVVMLKKMTQTALLVKKDEMDEDNVNIKKTQISQINETEIRSTVVNCRERFEYVKEQQEKVCLTEAKVVAVVENEKIIINKPSQRKYEYKDIILQSGFRLREGVFSCKNCKIYFDIIGESKIEFSNVEVCFENCIFVHKRKNKTRVIGNGGKIIFKNCHFEDWKFDIQGFIQVNYNCKFEAYSCSVNNCNNTFLRFENTDKAIIQDCSFTNHSDRCIEISSCGKQNVRGVDIKNCVFSGFKECGAYKEHISQNDVFSMFLTDENLNKNAIIYVTGSHVYSNNCIFENANMAAYRAEVLDEEIFFVDCKFKNIYVGSEEEGVDKRIYYTGKAIDIPGGLCFFGNCDFEDVSNIEIGAIGHFLNAISQVKNCRFSDCRGKYEFYATQVINCTFLRCTVSDTQTAELNEEAKKDLWSKLLDKIAENTRCSLIHIGGLAASGEKRCLSEISDCRFTECVSRDLLIEPVNVLHRREVCVSINNNIFENCITGSGEMFALDYKQMDGKSGGIIATESSNRNLNVVEKEI
ncbi:MAG: right-handed parallel beta-helix repeat-containing protein [Clostridia bacterium]|nr:right-handed parallel beta-helix repeat-containing protein [Clostridia bacterium]